MVEKPGVSPAVLFHLIGNTAFLRLTDVASGLPEYTEEVRLVGLEPGPPGEPSQASYYRKHAGELETAVRQFGANDDWSPRALQTLDHLLVVWTANTAARHD